MNEFHEPMYWSMATFHPASFILYILAMFVAGIFCSNMIIAVLKIYYSETMEKYEYEDIDVE
jgi:Na+/H+ antiporter NhaD/arsenite permease-like protein